MQSIKRKTCVHTQRRVGAGAPGTAGRKRWSIKHTFKAATFHQITAGEIWARDVVTEKALVLNSTVRVPDLPGLGVTIDRDAIAELEVYQPPTQADWIMRSRFGNGSTMYTRIELTARTSFMAVGMLHLPELLARPGRGRWRHSALVSFVATGSLAAVP